MIQTIRKNEMMALLPSSVNYEHIENSGKGKIEKFDMNIIKFILHSIVLKSVAFKGGMEVINYFDQSYLSRNYWVETIGTDYLRYIELLRDEKIIYRTPYQEKTCFGYGLVVPYRYSRINVEVIQIKGVHKHQNKKFNSSYTKKYEKPLSDFFVNTDFAIDGDKAENDLFERYFGLANYQLKKSHGKPIASDLKSYSSYLMALKKMVQFMNGEYMFSRSTASLNNKKTGKKDYKTKGRLYTSFSFLNKEIRQNLIYKGGKLIEIDLKNCVPYLLSNLFSVTNIRMTSKRVSRLQFSLSIYMCSEDLKTCMDREIVDFKNLCIEGTVYDIFIEPLKEKYAKKWSEMFIMYFDKRYVESYKHDRALAKQLFIMMLFGKISQFTEVQQVFAESFPILWDVLTTKKKQSYKAVAKSLFDLEGSLMIDQVAKPLIKNHKRKIPVFSVHDCIATTEENIPVVTKQIESVFYSSFGNVPRISID
ncbi:hypothetical protein [Chryseobacterium luteum]|uniref:DNA-directed RNA polymerase n=1 Tax=Chryseobacterium luteum TaxID=421531 RepID=A0A085ZU51_9FLAO|nr:hypothetical protein [Chryseobacterium luteum]KFF07965.1 hypothetical protein IX38_07310 [Chryseobacterium luteum]